MLWAQQPGYNAGGSYPIPVQQQQQQHMRAANQPIAGLQQDEGLQKTVIKAAREKSPPYLSRQTGNEHIE